MYVYRSEIQWLFRPCEAARRPCRIATGTEGVKQAAVAIMKSVCFNRSDVKFWGWGVRYPCSHQGIETAGSCWHMPVCVQSFFSIFSKTHRCFAVHQVFSEVNVLKECGADRMPPSKEENGFSLIFEFLNYIFLRPQKAFCLICDSC